MLLYSTFFLLAISFFGTPKCCALGHGFIMCILCVGSVTGGRYTEGHAVWIDLGVILDLEVAVLKVLCGESWCCFFRQNAVN